MTEPEDLEEDLFADLYTDEDDTSKPVSSAPEIKSEPLVVNGSSAVKDEDAAGEADYEPPGDQQDYNNEQDHDDDEIDFNLGNGNDYSAPPLRGPEAHGPGIKEDG